MSPTIQYDVLTTTMPNKLHPFGLESYHWLEQYLVDTPTVQLELPINGTTVVLKLEADETKLPQENTTCQNSITGGEGVCKYVTLCNSLALALDTLQSYSQFYCSVNGYAGVCCSEEPPKAEDLKP